MLIPIAYLIPLAVGVTWGVVCDLRRRRIPNAVSGLVFAAGLVTRGHLEGGMAVVSGLAAALALVLLLYRPWVGGAIGGGDVKLAAAVGAWVGLAHLVWFVLVAALAGGVVAAVVYFLAPATTRAEVKANLVLAGLHGQLADVPSHRKGHASVPYALAISAGAAVALLVA
jgi:Flp pilus assembly protein protease CpaA